VACPPAKARAIAAAIPHAQLEWVEGAGHALNLEAPDALDISGL
jgi:pimeloyl-ACP methyl ester carboxylesterase